MIKYGESKIDQIMFGEQMINKVYYGPSLLFEPGDNYWITGTTVEPNQSVTIFPDNGQWKMVVNSDNKSVFKVTPEYNTEYVSSMMYMFWWCTEIKSLNLGNVNTDRVTNMQSMFSDCTNLQSLDISRFDTERVTNHLNMFSDCSKLSYIRCTQTFKDWCMKNMFEIRLPRNMYPTCPGVWDIVGEKINPEFWENDVWIQIETSEPNQPIEVKYNSSGGTFNVYTDENCQANAYSICRNENITVATLSFETNSNIIKFKVNKKNLNVNSTGIKLDSLTTNIRDTIEEIDISGLEDSLIYRCNKLCYYCKYLKKLDLGRLDFSTCAEQSLYKDMFVKATSLSYIRCTKAFKDWCIEHQDEIKLSDTKMLTDEGVWDIID